MCFRNHRNGRFLACFHAAASGCAPGSFGRQHSVSALCLQCHMPVPPRGTFLQIHSRLQATPWGRASWGAPWTNTGDGHTASPAPVALTSSYYLLLLQSSINPVGLQSGLLELFCQIRIRLPFYRCCCGAHKWTFIHDFFIQQQIRLCLALFASLSRGKSLCCLAEVTWFRAPTPPLSNKSPSASALASLTITVTLRALLLCAWQGRSHTRLEDKIHTATTESVSKARNLLRRPWKVCTIWYKDC